MKRKTFIAILAIAMVLVLSLAVLTACNNKKHDFSSKWEYDETSHWHECMTKKHSDVADKADHTFDEGVITTPSTEDATGVKTLTCTVCGYQKTESVPQLGHTFDMDSWKYDAQKHWHPATCAHTDLKKDEAEHTWNEGEVIKPADYGVVGTKKFTCTVCGYEKTEDIDALGAKDNEIKLVAGKTLGKEYDGEVVSITKDDFVIDGNRVPTIMFKAKGADDNTYTATAPKNVGEYTVKVSAAATAEWKATTNTFDFAITPMVIGVDWEKEYDNSNILTGEPAELLAGDEATITVTMESANVGAAVQSFEITGKDAGNYSLAIEDVNVAIVKADIYGFEISNAAAFEKGFYVGATNIPEPTTDYVEIGTGYGERTIVWEMQLEGGVWSRNLTKEEVMQSKTGTFRVRIKYAEGDNYNFGATPSVSFTLNVKPRTLNVTNFDGKTYDGTPVANFNYDALEDTVEITDLPGVNDLTSPYNGEQYAEYRKKGEALWTKVTDTYIPKNAAEYEYRIGIKATDEWEAVVSDIKSFTIAQVEIKLEKGYVTTSTILQNGDLLYLASYTPVAGETIALRLVNGKAGLELTAPGSGYVKQDQKKQVSVQSNLDCFKLTATTSTNLSNYKLVKDPKQTSVEITVPPSGIGTSTLVTGKSESIDAANNKKLSMWTTVNTGSFQVGQTVIVSDKTGTKLFEAKIVRVGVVDPDGDGSYNTTSQSGCVIPSDGKVCIQVDTTGLTYDVNKVVEGTIRVK